MLNIEGVDKSSLIQELDVFLNKFIVKHATNPDTLEVRLGIHTRYGNKQFQQLIFHDPRFPNSEPVGAVTWVQGDRNPMEYQVTSRLIQNDKYRWHRVEASSHRTKDLNKALKSAVEFIKPYGMAEFAIKSREKASNKHRAWKDAPSQSSFRIQPSKEDIVKEIDNLLAMGYEFITDGFKQAVTNLPEFKEYKRRVNEVPQLQCVMFALGKVIVIPQDTNGNLGTSIDYSALDAVPEKMREKVSVLKLSEDGIYIPNIGYRDNENTFWVYDRDVV